MDRLSDVVVLHPGVFWFLDCCRGDLGGGVVTRMSTAWKRWSTDELAILHEAYPRLGLTGCLPLLPGFAPHRIQCKASKLGLKVPVDPDRSWSEEQTDFLRRYYARRPAKWIGEQLGKSLGAVHTWAYRKGFSRNERRQGSICACADHAWLPLSGGHTTFLDPADLEAANSYAPWSFNGMRYAASRKAPQKSLHRYLTATPAHLVVDHLNGDGLDNRRSNLRVCTTAENLQNIRQPTRAASGYRGVKRCTGRGWRRWRAVVRRDGLQIHLGTFSTAEEAARAYDAWVLEHRGSHVVTNFPQEMAA